MNVSQFAGQRRAHIGLGVTDLDRAERFYTTLLGVEPAKRRPGYLKFTPDDPALNLSLNQVEASSRSVDATTHYGIEVKAAQAVDAAAARMRDAGFAVTEQRATACCYAVQDKVWAVDPDGHRWEVFVVQDPDVQINDDQSSCCPGTAKASCA